MSKVKKKIRNASETVGPLCPEVNFMDHLV